MNENIIGKRIRKLRREQELSARQVGVLMGCPAITVYTWERQEINISSYYIIKLCKALNTTPNYLLGWTDEK